MPGLPGTPVSIVTFTADINHNISLISSFFLSSVLFFSRVNLVLMGNVE